MVFIDHLANFQLPEPQHAQLSLPESCEIIEVDFCIDHYSDELFDRYHIDKPKTLSRAVTKRKAEYLAGRICASKALEKYSITAQIPSGDNREPLFPASLLGSITHSHSKAFAMVAEDANYRGLGIDCEAIVDKKGLHTIRKMVINSDEIANLDRVNLPSSVLYSIIFSLKESFYKAAFSEVQRFFGFEAISVTHIDTTKQCIQFRVNEALSPNIRLEDIHIGHYALLNKHVLSWVTLPRLSIHNLF